MKEIFDIIVWVGFIYFLFVFLRGLNETQIQKHDEALKKQEEKQNKKDNLEGIKIDD